MTIFSSKFSPYLVTLINKAYFCRGVHTLLAETFLITTTTFYNQPPRKQSKNMSAIKFFVESVRRWRTVGAISRSSRFIGKTMCKYIDFDKAMCIVELGAGDGPVTQQILKRMRPDAKLFCFEINDVLIGELREIYGSDPRVTIIQDDAAKMGEYIQKAGFNEIDAVFSEIPFTIIPDDTIIKEAKKWMRMGAKYTQLHYSKMVTKRYQNIFGNVEIDFVMLNLPPAFIHICEKRD